MEQKKMINAERFKEEINKCNNDFGLTDNIVDCETLGCRNCLFSNFNNSNDGIIFCSTRKVKWLLSEYKEPVKLSELEHSILEWIYNECYEYIAKDNNGDLYAYCSEPRRLENSWYCDDGGCDLTVFSKLFDFINWEDALAVNIDNLLNNCEVVEDESNE